LKKDRQDLEFFFLKNNSQFSSELLQLNLYFNKKIKNPVIDCLPIGTTFQIKVWNALAKIPYGKLKTYKEIALEISSPNSSRAVGNACGKNNLPIIIPCHRVIGSNFTLGGFSAGTEIKKILLKLENENNLYL
jgi:methylated-DNA-[protein]-cysteine S-methyltransferase